ncbi:Glu/Leu/Phe/Val dehydrogenase dimerization domain-containing protein [Segeticoccus rhizosphaerae]|uniref:Glu/Leu/Phe/Val dehydrogenase dimerization domain-containing protein n=1 Tax=Segeticoccus rhizosphaerae TaxID=1104777 RepID=UPI0010C09845|nr:MULTISPECIES: Glu/Leu/Phe/Val dehydrogenase dimerization domain-containing protein [Intrasporangiaceae]
MAQSPSPTAADLVTEPGATPSRTRWNAPGPFGPSEGHEQVAYCHDRATGLRAIIAIHSTALGPALGGTRFFPYETEDDALQDVLRLSRGMTYKNALAGLDLGGGKAVIIGDPSLDKSEALLRAYGRFVESLGGRYVTACDVGTYVADIDVVGRETSHAVGRSEANGGCGDSSVLTAYGVFQAMRASAEHVWGEPTLSGRTVGIAGVGKVGHLLAEHLLEDGAQLVVTDVNTAAVEALQVRHPDIEQVEDATALVKSDLDVYAPCAMGGAIDDATVETLSARIVCGSANNQLVDEGEDGTAARLLARGIVYAPDFLANSGGVIQVCDELHGFNFERCKARVSGLFEATASVLRRADEHGISPATAAAHLAEERIEAVGNTRRIYLPRRR